MATVPKVNSRNKTIHLYAALSTAIYHINRVDSSATHSLMFPVDGAANTTNILTEDEDGTKPVK